MNEIRTLAADLRGLGANDALNAITAYVADAWILGAAPLMAPDELAFWGNWSEKPGVRP
jgi:hypothetical protein